MQHEGLTKKIIGVCFDVGLLVNFGKPKLEFKRLHR